MHVTLRFALTLALTLVPLAARECGDGKNSNKSPEEIQREVEQRTERVASGLWAVATAVDGGIDIVREFREAGEITPEWALERARLARDFNAFEGELVGFFLSQDNPDARLLHVQLSELLDRASRLQDAGVIHVKNGRKILAFNLTATAARVGLQIAAQQLKSAPEGLRIALTDSARENLRAARARIDSNDAKLREAITRLEGIVGAQ